MWCGKRRRRSRRRCHRRGAVPFSNEPKRWGAMTKISGGECASSGSFETGTDPRRRRSRRRMRLIVAGRTPGPKTHDITHRGVPPSPCRPGWADRADSPRSLSRALRAPQAPQAPRAPQAPQAPQAP
eukprot:gene7854-biopygen7584